MNEKKKSLFTHSTIRLIVISALLEFIPVCLFLIALEHIKIYGATVVLIVSTILSTIITFRFQKRIPYIALYVALITTIFGYMTLHFREVRFIQIRDTLYDVILALTLLMGMFFRTPLLKTAFHDVIPMSFKAWKKLTWVWIIFFIIAAVGNEMIRRFMDFPLWVYYKTFMVIVTTLFGIISLYLCYEEEDRR